MKILSSSKSTQPFILACLSNNNNPRHSPKTINIENDSRKKPKQQKQTQKQKQAPSVAEIERVIGAGVFRDRDISNRNSEQNQTLFDKILLSSIGKSEGKVEQKLRETGEWLVDGTEKASYSAGKSILLFVFLVVLPTWIFSFLVASGIIKMPFNSPYLDDLIM